MRVFKIYRQKFANTPAVAAMWQAIVAGVIAFVGISLLSVKIETILLQGLRHTLGQIAVTTAALIDAEQHRKFVQERRAAPREYAAAEKPLRALLKSNPDIRFAYTGIIDHGVMRYVLDADPQTMLLEADPNPPLPGERLVWKTGRLFVEEVPTRNSWGTGLRAFAPIRDAKGQVVGYAGVTMREERYAAYLRNIQRAEHLAGLACLLLVFGSGLWIWRIQKERNQALDGALAASKAKSQFLANMSHEIRTPMNGVLGLLELLRLGDLSAKQRNMADIAYRSAHGLLAILNDILDFSKIESGKLSVEQIVFDIRQAVDHVTSALQPSADSKSITLESYLEPRLPQYVRGDPVRFRQILFNLVGNAVKFTERGGVIVTVDGTSESLEKTPGDRLTVTIAVKDTGIGIDPESVADLFRPFSQVDNSTSRRFGGTGLGLSIIKELAGLMDGKIDVDSRPGQGSTFRVELKLGLVTDLAAGAMTEQPPRAPPPRIHTATARYKILLVEDNPVNRSVATAMLESLGHACVVAENGAEALRRFALEEFDAILMDCQMQVMDGYAATNGIRDFEANTESMRGRKARTPIIALTANALSGDRERCLEAGMDDYLAKPHSPDALASALTAVIEDSAAPARVTAPATR